MMTTTTTCTGSSLAAGEALAGSTTQADSWLLVEAPGRWERDVESTPLPGAARRQVDVFGGRVQLVRQPGRGAAAPLAFTVASEAGRPSIAVRPLLEPAAAAAAVAGPLVLVCCHGRRDVCCSRLGVPVFDALRAQLPADAVWQTSHVGGHRFAANVLVLPEGVLLGRVGVADAPHVATEVLAGRIPLEHYRGRTAHPPQAQAADAEVRRAFGLRGLEDVGLLAVDDGQVRLDVRGEALDVAVEVRPGPPIVESCGKEAAASVVYSVRW